jgi:hypothetical protein
MIGGSIAAAVADVNDRLDLGCGATFRSPFPAVGSLTVFEFAFKFVAVPLLPFLVRHRLAENRVAAHEIVRISLRAT